jgi:hypothetical protein
MSASSAAPSLGSVDGDFDDRPYTASSQADSDLSSGRPSSAISTPAARLEKLRQQKLLQQQKMKQRAGAAPSMQIHRISLILFFCFTYSKYRVKF